MASTAANTDSVSSTSQTSVLVWEKPSSPYFLHSSENPGLILVNWPLTEENYATWSRAIIYALDSKNKTDFVDGTIKAPTSSSDPIFPTWKKCNIMVFSWLINSMSKDLISSVIYLNTAQEVWIDLKNRFSQSNGLRVFELRRMVSTLSLDNLSVSSYYTRFKVIWDELVNYKPIPSCSYGICTCGSMAARVKYQEEECTMNFLMGLNESFATVRGQILLMKPLPSLN
ncbi:retrovirus-related Pol polyprotein from transposon RE1 [Quercus robur]|uniref:retrovirus-related Pol polyprotein from transposon RE1 n=1 Tax=Quercus robur TaxID=38942 RepID=UPI002163AF40|nr:retrovirus-related Pol polyprotein from transposon RE1 [Quercus robur]